MKHSPKCAECDSTAEFRCTRCQHFYCSDCDKEIHSRRSFRDHCRLPITNKSFETVYCDEHPDEKLKIWCHDCHKAICYECLSNTHKDHKDTRINKSSNELEKKVSIKNLILTNYFYSFVFFRSKSI